MPMHALFLIEGWVLIFFFNDVVPLFILFGFVFIKLNKFETVCLIVDSFSFFYFLYYWCVRWMHSRRHLHH